MGEEGRGKGGEGERPSASASVINNRAGLIFSPVDVSKPAEVIRRSRVRIPLATGFFPGSSYTRDFKIGTPVATLSG